MFLLQKQNKLGSIILACNMNKCYHYMLKKENQTFTLFSALYNNDYNFIIPSK